MKLNVKSLFRNYFRSSNLGKYLLLIFLKLKLPLSLYPLSQFERLIITKFGLKCTILQIGANDGKNYDPVNWILQNTKSNGYLIEHIKIYFKELQKEYKNNSRVKLINKCVTNKKSKVTMSYVKEGEEIDKWQRGIASLNPDFHKKSNTNSKSITSTEVEGDIYENIIIENNINKVDVLVTDCEGYDIELLKLYPFESHRPTIIQLEFEIPLVYNKKETLEAFKILIDNNYYNFLKTGGDLIAW